MKDGKIHPREWKIYNQAYKLILSLLPPPDLFIFLDISPEVAYERIKNRNRQAENDNLLSIHYLKRLHREYQHLLEEIKSGEHPWSFRMEVWEIDWNEDWKSFDPIVENIHTLTRILNFFNQEDNVASFDENYIRT